MSADIPIIRLYHGQIEIKTPLCIGAGNPEGLEGVAQIFRDGRGEGIIPGKTISGVFFEDLEWFQNIEWLQDKDINTDIFLKSWMGLSGKLSRQRLLNEHNKGRSALRFASAPITTSNSKYGVRDRIRLNSATRTVDDKAKFAQEQVIAGTCFDFELEIEIMFLFPQSSDQTVKDELRDNLRIKILSQIEQVLKKWMTEGFFLGGSSSAGNGWALLCDLKKWDVKNDTYDDFLALKTNHYIPVLNESSIYQRDVSIKFEITLNNDNSNWGLDFIEIHQGDQYAFTSELDAPFYTEWQINNNNSSDRNCEEYFIIPGSSLRGAMRAFLSSYFPEKYIDLWFGKALLGDEGSRSLIRIRDAKGETVKSSEKLIVRSHAEDEFIGSTFESSLFDHCPLLKGSFSGEMRYPSIYINNFHNTDREDWFSWAFKMLHLEEAGFSKNKDNWIKDALLELPNALNFFFEQAGKNRVCLGHGGGHAKWVIKKT
ncbi:MAG: hypothetical protein HQK79_19885 [Desulfobacterales bacterium]|nr:hypothetical protein [Desulfobacterales bacterium]